MSSAASEAVLRDRAERGNGRAARRAASPAAPVGGERRAGVGSSRGEDVRRGRGTRGSLPSLARPEPPPQPQPEKEEGRRPQRSRPVRGAEGGRRRGSRAAVPRGCCAPRRVPRRRPLPSRLAARRRSAARARPSDRRRAAERGGRAVPEPRPAAFGVQAAGQLRAPARRGAAPPGPPDGLARSLARAATAGSLAGRASPAAAALHAFERPEEGRGQAAEAAATVFRTWTS